MMLPGQLTFEPPVLLELTIPGIPRPKGSFTTFVAPAGHVVVKGSVTSRSHQLMTSGYVRQAWGPRGLVLEPVQVWVRFQFARPAWHWGTGANRLRLVPRAPLEHTQAPDLDKLVRLTFDALTGVVWADDAQAIALDAAKAWTADRRSADQTVLRLSTWDAP